MSGTSLDGVDAVVLQFEGDACHVAHTHSLPYSRDLRDRLLELHISSFNELEFSAVAGNVLALLYAEAVSQLLEKANLHPADIQAIGCHGQTIRHRPDLEFTLQIGNPALLAELSEIDVVADFRSRDIAAGGQGAPLVPAFHQFVFSHPQVVRTIVNIGGIANLSYLPIHGNVTGFDSGPGNMLMDAWVQLHLNQPYDESGRWAEQGEIIEALLTSLLSHPYFQTLPPKSTGRDLFSLSWLQGYLQTGYEAVDVQRTLLEFTARSVADAIHQHCAGTEELYLCGGGAYNAHLAQRLQLLLGAAKVGLTDELGIPATWVEAAAFAWLARQTMHHLPGNLPAVTGAKGPRVLGAVYCH